MRPGPWSACRVSSGLSGRSCAEPDDEGCGGAEEDVAALVIVIASLALRGETVERIEQTRRRLAKLRVEGLVDRITLPRAGRTRVSFATHYGADVACEWPERSGSLPSWVRTVPRPGCGSGMR